MKGGRPGTLLWVSVPGPELESEDRRFLERIDPAGVVIFRENVRSADQVRELNMAIRQSCPSGRVLIAVDQEGGARCQAQGRGSRPPPHASPGENRGYGSYQGSWP